MLGRCQVGAANLDRTCFTNLDPSSNPSKLNPKLPYLPCRLWQQRRTETQKWKMTTTCYLIYDFKMCYQRGIQHGTHFLKSISIQSIQSLQSLHVPSSFCSFYWLVVDLPLWKIWKSTGMTIPNIWENMFRTTNQSIYNFYKYGMYNLMI